MRLQGKYLRVSKMGKIIRLLKEMHEATQRELISMKRKIEELENKDTISIQNVQNNTIIQNNYFNLKIDIYGIKKELHGNENAFFCCRSSPYMVAGS